MSRASAAVPKHKLKLHWEVELCKPSEFKDAVFIPKNKLRRSMRAYTRPVAEDEDVADGEVSP